MIEGTIGIKGRSESEIEEALSTHNFNLTADEARRVADLLGRDPTVVELTIFNTMWSEHCSYKSSKEILARFLPTRSPDVVLGPGEDAGVIRFAPAPGGDWYCLVLAHESHNHPSQVLPVEGASTGIGGIVRDVYCMGADVVGVLDPLRFGNPEGKEGEKVISIARGVVEGIAQYGNALGVPNMGGDVVFDGGFDENCLVNVVAAGVVKESELLRSRVPDEAANMPYQMILVGKPTDDSGFGGAAFASEDLASEEETDRGAVQVPDPFLKRVLSEANRKVLQLARDKGCRIGFKDLGAGGIACATSEMADAGGFGVSIDLDQVNLASGDFPPAVVSCSETQERYCLAVPEDMVEDVLKIYNRDFELPHLYHGAGAVVIGDVTREKGYRIKSGGELVCDTPVNVITTGISYQRPGKPGIREFEEPELERERSLHHDFLKVIGSPNIASRNLVYRRYDSEVRGRAVLRPGEADASVFAPLEDEKVGIALSVDGNPFYGKIDPNMGGALAVCEAARNVASVGGVPSAVTDCLNYGNPEVEEVFWEFYQGVRGVAEACRGIGHISHPGSPIPVVSGNVSFYNQGESGVAVPPSPIICCVGVVEDYSRCRSIKWKDEGSSVYLIGEPLDELGGSEYYRTIYGTSGANVPQADFIRERRQMEAVIDMHRLGWINSCHDVGQGGMLTALAEMAISERGDCSPGFSLELDILSSCNLSPEKILFSETGAFIVEVAGAEERDMLALSTRHRVKIYKLGELNPWPRLEVLKDGERMAVWELDELKQAYMDGCSFVFGK